jgi:cyclophilin family peptidyl-prolyl cis-trans isomerase
MINKFITIIAIVASFLFLSCKSQNKEAQLLIKTDLGNITVKLYNETPKHRDNFIKLIKAGFYNERIFHRVIKNFMIQGGDESLPENITNSLVKGSYEYTIPAEITPKYYHKKGALAAARMGDNENPLQESSSTQFYIVQGEKYTEEKLKNIEDFINKSLYKKSLYKFYKEEESKYFTKDSIINYVKVQQLAKEKAQKFIETNKFKYTEEQKNVLINQGGAPHLDMNYTVFGEVTEGMDVVDKIAAVQTGEADRPITDIKFSIEIKE